MKSFDGTRRGPDVLGVRRSAFGAGALLAGIVFAGIACSDADPSPPSPSGGVAGSAGSPGSQGGANQAGKNQGGSSSSGSPGVSGAGSAGTPGVSGAGSGGTSGAGGGAAGAAGAPAGSGGGGAAGSNSGGSASGSGGTSGAAGAAAGNGGTASGGGGRGGAAGAAGQAGAGGGGAYNPCPTTPGMPCAVLPLGDSITEGCCTGMYGGYRIELFRRAVADRKNLTFVGTLMNGPTMVGTSTFPRRHQGHGGFTIDSGAGHSGISGMITDNALSTYRPHIVLLMIGTNDINGNVDVNNAPTRLGNLIDDITTQSPNSLLVVASIIPTRTDGTNQRVQAYNMGVRQQVTMRANSGKHVVFLDNYAAISSNANYKTALLADNLHPNDAGYVVLGQSFYGVIGPLLPAAP